MFNTPLTEQGIAGFAIGLASMGHTAIAEIQFADYIFPAFDQVRPLHLPTPSRGSLWTPDCERSCKASLPLWWPVRSRLINYTLSNHECRARRPVPLTEPRGFLHGSLRFEGRTIPCLCVMTSHAEAQIVIPRSPIQAKGLLLASIRDPNPVIFMEPKILYRSAG